MDRSLVGVLVTGSTGFLGGSVCRALSAHDNCSIKAQVRNINPQLPWRQDAFRLEDLSDIQLPSEVFDNIDVVIHCAARVHIMNERSSDPLSEFRKVNVIGTLAFAKQAASAGVKRFIFISSIKVNGEATFGGNIYHADDTPSPQDPYGVSKLEAEEGLRKIAVETGLEVVIIRPVLVYGPGVKANFHSMMRWLSRGVPLPLGAIKNKRSLVCLDNLVDLIVTCLDHPAAANQVFLAADGEDLSTTDLLRRMSKALGRPARLLPAPMWLLTFSASLLGKKDVAQRLCGSLQVDISKARQLLGWNPPVSVDEGLKRTATAFIESVRQ